MLQRSTKAPYFVAILALVLVLTGCELRRDESNSADPGPVSDSPPTLAPLEAETNIDLDMDMIAEATAVPTIEAVMQPSNVAQEVAAVISEEPVEPESVAMDLSAGTEEVAAAEEAPVVEEVSIADTEPTAADLTVEEETDSVEALVVDAAITEELPTGGPVAAAPPSSPTFDDGYAPPAYGESSTYAVQPGDTLFSIARRFGSSVETIMYENGLASDTIRVGQLLTVSGNGYAAPTYGPPTYDPYTQQTPTFDPYAQQAPAYEQQPAYQQPYYANGNEGLHVVESGENLFRIALQYGTTVDAIAAANGLPHPFILQQGQQLLIPAPGAYGPADGYPQQPYGQSRPGYDPYAQQPPTYGQQPYDNYGQQAPVYDQQPYDNYGQQPPAYGQQPPAYGYEQQPAYDPYAQGGAAFAPQDNTYMNPGNTGTHTIAPGETLFSIAQRYGTSADSLAAANGLTNPNQVYVGQVLYLP